MRIFAGFIYIVWNIVYLSPFIPGTALWFGLDKIMHCLLVGTLCYFLQQDDGLKYSEKLFFEYLTFLSIANGLYLGYCIYADKTFKLYNTPLFAYILGIGFVVFLFHCAYKKL